MLRRTTNEEKTTIFANFVWMNEQVLKEDLQRKGTKQRTCQLYSAETCLNSAVLGVNSLISSIQITQHLLFQKYQGLRALHMLCFAVSFSLLHLAEAGKKEHKSTSPLLQQALGIRATWATNQLAIWPSRS